MPSGPGRFLPVDAAQYVLRALRAGAAWFLVKPTRRRT
jgi:hypothetical protein